MVSVNEFDNELSTPLLPPGVGERAGHDHHTRSKDGQGSRNRRKSDMVKQSARAKSQDLSQGELERMKRASSSDFSVGTTDVTEPINNKEEKMKDEEMHVNTMTKIKVAVVVLATLAAVASYFVAFLVTTSVAAPAVNLTTLAVAAGVCVATTPFVWINEWKLIRYPGENATVLVTSQRVFSFLAIMIKTVLFLLSWHNVALRRTINVLRGEVARLNREINFLNMEITDLKIELER